MYDWSYFAPDPGKNAAMAIRLDSEGSKAQAVKYYQRACDDLVELARTYSRNYQAVKVWMERHNAYQNRIRALKLNLQ